MGASNSTVCHVEAHKPANNATIIGDGAITLQIHQVGFIVSGACAFFATVVSAWLVARHLSFYTNRKVQRHIVRILFLVPICACGADAERGLMRVQTPAAAGSPTFSGSKRSTSSSLATAMRPCVSVRMEAADRQVVIYSFFYLLVAYLGTTNEELRTVFRRVELKKWMWPMGWVKYRPSSGWHCASVTLVSALTCRRLAPQQVVGRFLICRPACCAVHGRHSCLNRDRGC